MSDEISESDALANGRPHAQGWGDWTVEKLGALAKYLERFTTASQKAKGTLYLDLFAGTAENCRRSTGEPIDGSALTALKTSPPLTRTVFCELDQKRAESLEATLKSRFPGRDTTVLRGDCNQTIREYLDHLKRHEPGWRRAPSFAFIDQYVAEVDWETLQLLSRFRVSPPQRPARKMELWLYFGESFIPRGSFGGVNRYGSPRFVNRVTKMFGNDDWLELRRRRIRDEIEGADYTAELTNYMRWRLEQDLGYSITIPLRVLNEHGSGIYTMIFATDDEAGQRIMRSVSANAAKAIDEMVRVHKAAEKSRRSDEQAGSAALIEMEPYYEAKDGATSSKRSLDKLMEGPAVKPDWLP